MSASHPLLPKFERLLVLTEAERRAIAALPVIGRGVCLKHDLK